MPYVDGFVAAVPTANREKFMMHAEQFATALKEFGALSVVECWGRRRARGQAHLVPDGRAAQSR